MTDESGDRERPVRSDVDESVEQEVTLLELVNRTVDRGVVLHGDAIISVADVDLIELRLELVLSAVDALVKATDGDGESGAEER